MTAARAGDVTCRNATGSPSLLVTSVPVHVRVASVFSPDTRTIVSRGEGDPRGLRGGLRGVVEGVIEVRGVSRGGDLVAGVFEGWEFRGVSVVARETLRGFSVF